MTSREIVCGNGTDLQRQISSRMGHVRWSRVSCGRKSDRDNVLNGVDLETGEPVLLRVDTKASAPNGVKSGPHVHIRRGAKKKRGSEEVLGFSGGDGKIPRSVFNFLFGK